MGNGVIPQGEAWFLPFVWTPQTPGMRASTIKTQQMADSFRFTLDRHPKKVPYFRTHRMASTTVGIHCLPPMIQRKNPKLQVRIGSSSELDLHSELAAPAGKIEERPGRRQGVLPKTNILLQKGWANPGVGENESTKGTQVFNPCPHT